MADIYSYNSFRTYLNDALHHRHGDALNLTQCAIKMGFQHTSSLTKILNGERFPGKRAVASITKYLRMSDDECMRFMMLVQAEKSGMTRRINTTPKLSFTPTKKRCIKGAEFSRVANWPCFTLKELAASPYFSSNPSYLAEKLRFRVSASTVESTLNTLRELDLLAEETDQVGSKRYVVRTDTTVDLPNVYVRKHQAQMLELAAKALETQGTAEREFGTSTFLMDISKLPEAKQMMRNFIEEFLSRFEAKDTEQPHDVYQLNLNLFALTDLNTHKEISHAKN